MILTLSTHDMVAQSHRHVQDLKALIRLKMDKALIEFYQKPRTQEMTFITKLSEVLSISSDEWRYTVEQGLELIGKYFEMDQIECVIKSADKSHKSLINWFSDKKTAKTSIKEETDFINYLFKNQNEKIFYLKSFDKRSPSQLRKVLTFKGLKSAILLNLEHKEKSLGYITFGYKNEGSAIFDEELNLIRTFGVFLSNFIVTQHQSTSIQALVEKNGEQDRRLKEFAFITSHHLRAFSTNLSSLTEYLILNPSEQRFIKMINSSVKKLNGSIENINDILTNENDILPEDLSRIKVNSVIKKTLEWHRKDIISNEIKVENRLPNRLSINSQLEMLENIFSHILSNAIKYGTNKDSKKIRIDHSKNDEYLIIRIRDFGDGIDMKKYGNRLFKAGSRFSEKSNTNMGMGLFLSKYQMKKIGGRIHLKSEQGKGTSVQCYLPLQ